MCLKIVTKKLDANNLVKTGYKIFSKKTFAFIRLGATEYRSPCFDSRTVRKMGEKYDAVTREERSPGNNSLIADDGKLYDRGFHIWSKISDARNDCMFFSDVVVEVVAWDVRAYGVNDVETKRSGPPGKCFVARHIRLMKEVDMGD